MKEAYTLVKTKKRLTIKVYPAGFSFFQSSNIEYFFHLFPFLIAYFALLILMSWKLTEAVYKFILIDNSNLLGALTFESLYNAFLLFCFYIPIWMFVKSINTYGAIYFSTTTLGIEKQVLRFKKSIKIIPIKLISHTTLGLQAQMEAKRGSQDFGTALTSCAIVDCYQKEHNFGFWLSLYDQGVIVAEMSDFLNTLKKNDI
jgi:hypothetical protein